MSATAAQKPLVRPLRAQPIGKATALACGPGIGWLPVERPTYPLSEEGRRFRKARERARISMGDLARWLGISVVEVSGIETGSHLLTPDDWRVMWSFIPTAAMVDGEVKP